jgi:hypothetical protein
METTFTPSPWVIHDNGSYLDIGIKQEDFICSYVHPRVCIGVPYDNTSDAYLISCAPEMYELLKKISELIPELNPEDPYIDIDAMERDIKNLLAKARGEQ